jgi:hypothetical protein
MAIVEDTYVHEFLARFDRNGFVAAHIGEAVALVKDGVLMPGKTTLLDARPVGPDDAATLAEIGAQINTLAVAANAALTAERDAAVAAKAQAESERDTAVADAAALRAKYESPLSENGVPEWVWRSQAMKALIISGKKPIVDAAMAQLAQTGVQGQLAQVDYLESQRFYRDHQTTLMMIQGGLLTAQEADDLWKLAATFPV